MEKFGKSQSVTRVEDVRFLTGHGRYVDDIGPEGALHCYFLRATAAHGDITTLNVDAAREMPGVLLVVTADDLVAAGVELGLAGSTFKNRVTWTTSGQKARSTAIFCVRRSLTATSQH